MRVHICIYKFTHMYTNIHTHTCRHARMHTCIHAHSYKCRGPYTRPISLQKGLKSRQTTRYYRVSACLARFLGVTPLCIYRLPFAVPGGEDPYGDAVSLWFISRKRALFSVALLQKITCNLRHPMGLHHSVTGVDFQTLQHTTTCCNSL